MKIECGRCDTYQVAQAFGHSVRSAQQAVRFCRTLRRLKNAQTRVDQAGTLAALLGQTQLDKLCSGCQYSRLISCSKQH